MANNTEIVSVSSVFDLKKGDRFKLTVNASYDGARINVGCQSFTPDDVADVRTGGDLTVERVKPDEFKPGTIFKASWKGDFSSHQEQTFVISDSKNIVSLTNAHWLDTLDSLTKPNTFYKNVTVEFLPGGKRP